MGGQAINIFKMSRGDDPKEVNNWKLWFSVISFGIMGAARGVDEGLISGTFNTESFQRDFNLKSLDPAKYATVKGDVTAMVQIGCVGGAIIASVCVDRIGRIWSTRLLCVIWALGIAIFMASEGNLAQVYAGRFIAGLGVGQTAVVAPIYLAEIAPKSMRGMCSCVFAGAVYIGIMLAYFSTWGGSLHIDQTSPSAWRIPTSLHLIFAGIIFVLSFFNKESPRYYIKNGQHDDAVNRLAYLRNLPTDHSYVQAEARDIERQLHEEQEATRGAGWVGQMKELFLMPNNLYRIYVALAFQFLGQWTGAGSITVYAQDLFALVGADGQNEKLYVTVIFGVVKFCAALVCALFLVDALGRKRALAVGITCQSVGMAYIGVFLLCVPQIRDPNAVLTTMQKNASTGAIAMMYLSGVGWTMGINSIQYLISAEIYPLRIRGLATSITMVIHFSQQYGNSRALPNMALPIKEGGMGPGGMFVFFSLFSLVVGAWSWFFIPEMAGISLEGLDDIFTLRWYQIGRKGRQVALEGEERRRQETELFDAAGRKDGIEQMEVERVA